MSNMKFYLIIAAIFTLASISIYVFFLHQGPSGTTSGVILTKELVAESEYTQSKVGINRGFRGDTKIDIPSHYKYQIKTDVGVLVYSGTDVNEKFEVGDAVSVEYETRGVVKNTYAVRVSR